MSSCTSYSLTIEHQNSELIERLINAYKDNRLFGEFLPPPSDLSSKKWRRQVDGWLDRMLGDDDGVMSLAKWRFDNWGTLNELSADDFGNLEIISDHKVKLEVSLEGFPADGVIDHWIKLGFNINGTCENESGGCCYDEYIDSVPTTVVYQSDYDEPDCTNENGIERREIRKRVHVKRRVSIRSELKRAQRILEAKNGTAKRRSLQ